MKSFVRSSALCGLLALACACAPKPYGPVPSEQQFAWQDLEYYMFCHFGPNTFTGMEWGLGTEEEDIFAPTDLDCAQWARTAKAAGMKGIILTAKHHDGFCLWPSAYSTHTVAQRAWRDGAGDVLKDLSEACRAEGILFGVYISPWDRNHPAYGTDEYNDVFAKSIAEVHSKYGPVFEQWFDGANGGAKIPAYDWPLFYEAVYKHSPNAVIFSDIGPGCRWIGNERGRAGETNWCRLDVEGFAPGTMAPGADTLNCGNCQGGSWIPGEADVSIYKGWFYSKAGESTRKSVDDLMELYFSSVGRNANLLLNVPPDTTGHINPADSARLVEFRAAREAYFANRTASGRHCGAVTTLKTSAPSKCIVLCEDIRYGQRISSFKVEAKADGGWEEIAAGTTIGHKRILRFDEPVPAGRIRVSVTGSYEKPLIKSIELF